MRQLLDSIIKNANSEQISQGSMWYQLANQFCTDLSIEFGIEFEKVCGICAALSAQKSWSVNKKVTRAYLEGKRNLHTRRQISKCDWIMRGLHIEACLGGLKTINFYHNILNPNDTDWVTIDRWMLKIFNARPSLTPKQYNTLKNICIEYSGSINWISCRMQATAWIVMRGAPN